MTAERQSRAALRRQHDAFAAWLIPLVLAGCVVWLGVVTLTNVRERAGEIGILRALGVRSAQVFALVLSRAALVGLVGALLGYGAGILVGTAAGDGCCVWKGVTHDRQAAACAARILSLTPPPRST